jgi:hypothetical protein
MILSVDPGDTTGIAYWEDDGTFISREALPFEELLDKLNSFTGNITVIVCEDYRLRGGRQVAQTGSRFVAVQVIGALKLLAKESKARFVLQQPTVLTVASLHSGVKRPSNHSKSHDIDAYNHGYYYLETQGLLTPKPLY